MEGAAPPPPPSLLSASALPPTSPISSLPPELHAQIIHHLPIADIGRCMRVCSLWLGVINGLWKSLAHQHFPDFIATAHLAIPDGAFRDAIRVRGEASAPFPANPFVELQHLPSLHVMAVALSADYQLLTRDRTANERLGWQILEPTDWKAQYHEFLAASRHNISGDWAAHYGAHGLELVRVTQRGYLITTLKLKGDVNVPTGKPTFEMVLRRTGRVGLGRIHLANTGYRDPHWGFATLEVRHTEDEAFVIRWHLDPEMVVETAFWRPSEAELATINHTV